MAYIMDENQTEVGFAVCPTQRIGRPTHVLGGGFAGNADRQNPPPSDSPVKTTIESARPVRSASKPLRT